MARKIKLLAQNVACSSRSVRRQQRCAHATSGVAAFVVAAAVVVASLVPAVALAGAPSTLLYEGVLTTATGAAAPAGAYDITFSLYANQTTQVPFYTESASVKVSAGRINHVLGATKPLNITALNAASEVWVSVKIGINPAQTRRRMHSVAYAIIAQRAQIAFGLACTGCVKASALKWDADLDLAGNSIKAQKITAKSISAQQVVAQQFIGDGSQLSGIKIPSGTCPSGQVVTGIAPSGSLICKKSGVSGGALAQVSNGALSNQFTDLWSAPVKNVPIPDKTGLDAVSTIKVPNLGPTEKVTITIELTNSDLANVAIILLPPDDKKTGYIICDPCAANDTVKTYKKSFSGKLVQGDLSAWVGKNPAGFWNLKVKDNSNCQTAKPANAGLCKTGTDGLLKDWSIGLSTTSNTDIVVAGKLVATAGVQVGTTTANCAPKLKGLLRYNDSKGLEVCTGSKWAATAAAKKVIHYLGTCTSNGSSSTRTFCLNKTISNTAQDYLTVNTTNSGSRTDFNTGRILFKRKGYYRITWQQRSRGSLQAWLYKSGSQIQYMYDQGYSSYYNTMSGSRIIWFEVNNYFNIKYYSPYNAWYANDSTLEVEFLGL